MARKRANNEGSIFQRKSDNRWVGRLSLGKHPVSGKRLTKTVYGDSQAEVLAKMDTLRSDRKAVKRTTVNRATVTEFIARWLQHVKAERSPATYTDYELSTRLYVVPFLGSIPVSDLDADQLQTWLAVLHDEGHSANTRQRGFRTLRAALSHACRLGLRGDNPCKALQNPTVDRDERPVLSVEQCQDLFRECAEHRLGELITIGVLTGLRKRELFALEWGDVNLSECVLTVRRSLEELGGRLRAKTPKSKSGRRSVMLGEQAVAAFRERQRKAQREGHGSPIIFSDTTGGYLRGSNFDRRVWYPIREDAGIPKTVTFHDLRHTAASLLIRSGADIVTVQKRLGHAKASTTLDIYSHLMDDAQADAVERLNTLLDGAGEYRVGTRQSVKL